jgi:hypothetical protein
MEILDDRTSRMPVNCGFAATLPHGLSASMRHFNKLSVCGLQGLSQLAGFNMNRCADSSAEFWTEG